MKKRLLQIISAGLLLGIVSSCSVSVPKAFSGAPIGNKKGVSESFVILGIDLNQKYGIKEAASKGKISGAIATVDEKRTPYLAFLVFKKELIVTAE